MAIVLKEGKTFGDAYGNVYADAYGVIDQCNGNKKRKNQMFVLEFYKDKTAREEGKKPIHHVNYALTNDEFCEWFACDKITDNQYKNAYDYILQLRDIREEINPETNELEEVDYGPIWGDWEADEEVMNFQQENLQI